MMSAGYLPSSRVLKDGGEDFVGVLDEADSDSDDADHFRHVLEARSKAGSSIRMNQ